MVWAFVPESMHMGFPESQICFDVVWRSSAVSNWDFNILSITKGHLSMNKHYHRSIHTPNFFSSLKEYCSQNYKQDKMVDNKHLLIFTFHLFITDHNHLRQVCKDAAKTASAQKGQEWVTLAQIACKSWTPGGPKHNTHALEPIYCISSQYRNLH